MQPITEERTTAILPDRFAREFRNLPVASLLAAIQAGRPERSAKQELPLCCCGPLDGTRSPKGAVRHNAAVERIELVIGDHDAGTVSLQDAAQRLSAAGIAALLYTTPSHTSEKPRWRVVAPLAASVERGPGVDLAARYRGLVGRLDAALGGVLATESATLSQSYYVGSVMGAGYSWAEARGELLDAAGVAPVYAGAVRTPVGSPSQSGSERVEQWIASIATGAEYHAALLRLAGHLIAKGESRLSAVAILRGLMQAAPVHDARWEERLREVPRLVDDALRRGFSPKPINGARRDLFGEVGLPERFWLRELHGFTIPETPWLVDNMLSPGLTMLAAPPKAGKSYFALQMALCIASGMPFLGRRTTQTPVCYFDLEEWHRLLLDRVVRISRAHSIDKDAPVRIVLETSPKKVLDDMTREIEVNGVRLIILDLLARVRGELNEDARKGVYARDYEAIMRFSEFALAHSGLSVVVIHHTNKGIHTEWQSQINGSYGLTGATHSNILMTHPAMRGFSEEDKADAARFRVLRVVGKAVGDQEMTLEQMPDMGGWRESELRPWEVVGTNKQKQILLAMLTQREGWWTARRLTEEIGWPLTKTRQLLLRMAAKGMIESDGQGGNGYRIIDK